ncbi:hypothetical protein [Streptomyces sioyaensis]|uniref:hypothetical protein n=1 Tax=Streptomyces sioyaensis TaxID=67364 RepID=UPI001EF11C2D|nr:hypothetical protein [Streptomyces sioyaensis]
MIRRISAVAVMAAAATALALSGTSVAATRADGPPAPAAHGPVKARPAAGAHHATHGLANACWYSGSHWWCNNRSGAPVYKPGSTTVVGYMNSNPSWFVCRSDNGGHVGGPHPNRWEWTQADNGAWGWMKDTDISSETDPLPVC